MRLCWTILCAYVVLATGGANASEELTPLSQINIEAGHDIPASVRTMFDIVEGCYLVTPDGTSIEFMPEDNSSDKYELRDPVILYGCQVLIKNVDENDNGIWELYYMADTGAKGSQYYNITVTPREGTPENGGTPESENSSENDGASENENSTENGGNSENESSTENGGNSENESSTENGVEPENEENLEVKTTWLPTISFGARIDVNISITLSKKGFTEECYLRSPNGNIVKLEDADMSGVQTFPLSTVFVSCRVVIGPMTEDLLGTWTLCGRHIEGQAVIERCQPGNIAWSINNPTDNWASTTHPVFDHAVHYGGRISPAVRGSGVVNTCHVITPNGEDIAVTSESDYPGLTRTVLRDTTICNINIGAIDENFIGDWVLYGTYHSNFGFNVVSQPMTLFVYDEDNPYSQSYNVTNLDASTQIVNVGAIIIVEAMGTGNRRVDCEFITNTGERFNSITLADSGISGIDFVNVNNRISCRLQIGPITENMLGEWRLIGKFSRNNILWNEVQMPFFLIQEDPANPIEDESRTIQDLAPQDIYTTFGANHDITTATATSTDSCHIRTPNNLQYILRSGFNLSGVEIITNSRISCGVKVHVESEDMIGEWVLIARLNMRGTPIERRQPFTINVEVAINAVPREASIAVGNDLYLRLENPSKLPDTCTINGPARNTADVDSKYAESCGYVVRNITAADNGMWNITYGDKIKYKALVQVTVTGRSTLPADGDRHWIKDAPVNETFGPEDAVYCRIETASGLVVSENFGRCVVVMDRVTAEHAGVWKMVVATTGRVLTDTHEFAVTVAESEPKALVTTSVETNKPLVMLSCQLAGDHEVTACKFQNPSGKVLLATEGVGEDRYTFHGNTASVQSNVTSHSCGLRITDPVVTDLGLWRCAVETVEDTYYGFLTVLCPWAMAVPEIAAQVVSDATLTANTEHVTAVEGDNVHMSCSVQSAIRYCYFRAQNGTVFNVSPGSSGAFEYAGAGLDAGECSIRFPSLVASDSGRWSCHVGFNDPNEPEQRAQISLSVEALMVAQQYHLDNAHNTMVVEAQVHSHRTLDYCRFVRIDGTGFTSENVPAGYVDHSTPTSGHCEIRVDHPSILDQHPWTVIVKISGQDVEIARSTDHTLEMPPTDTDHGTDTDEGHGPDNTENLHPPPHVGSSSFVVIWSCVLIISLALFLIGLMMGPKKNREWTYRRATTIRTSIRGSFTKRPLPVAVNEPRAPTTPMAA